uniref:Growth arrest specific 2 n=2 Tax=Cynoglossus semilaevis TaxID=244447 RepID=A0A3P8UMS4_CYNSE
PPGLVKLERELEKEREEAGCLSPSSPLPLSFFPPSPSPSPSQAHPPPAPSSSPSPPPPPPPPLPPPPPVATNPIITSLSEPVVSDLPSATTNAAPTCPSLPPHSSVSSSHPCTTTVSTQTPLFSPPNTPAGTPPSAPPPGQTLVSAKAPALPSSPPAATTPRSSGKFTKRKSTGTNNVLDNIVRNIIENPPCSCSTRFVVEKQPKGCYRVGDKVLYIRMLNERHVMVRVGGGWETFISYLEKHDPCRGGGGGLTGRPEVKVCRLKAKPPTLNISSPDSYMVVGAHYRGKK